MMATQAPTLIKKTFIPVIERTVDYGKFRLMAGNRVVDYNHVKHLKREMEANPELLATNPILVNENWFIIDGQHRHQAARELGASIYYIMVPGLTIDATRHLNVTQRRWTLMDFATSFADSGRPEYKTFIEFVRRYPNITGSVIRNILAGGHIHGLEEDFRRGEFKIMDEEFSTVVLDALNQVVERTGTKINQPMATAFKMLIKGIKGMEPFDFKRFMAKLENASMREDFQVSSAVRNCLRTIENIYNYKAPAAKRLY